MMKRLLLLEGNTAEKRTRGRELGVRSSSEIYAEAISAHFPELELDVLNGGDPDEVMPGGRCWSDYAGLVVTGSSLHAYDREFAVTNQIALVKEAAGHGLPIFGSCWGLQIAVMAAGGEVAYNPKGREVGFARKILLNEAGRRHPMFSVLLASNAHSMVQAAVVPLGKSEVWAVQYHPEFDLEQLVQLYTLYARDMIAQGFFANEEDLTAYRDKIAVLAADPSNAGLAWQLGIDSDVLDDRRRRGEILAWIEARVLGAGEAGLIAR
ncbi:MAG: gamma-glutamyl-gamma-aminobutyrate hydrolase family protein [Novosphingobium sp.]